MIDFCQWLADASIRHRELPDLHQAFCDHLLAQGLPIWRSSLGLEVLHPEVMGAQFRWGANQAETGEIERSDQVLADYQNSPARIVDETGKVYRRRLDAPAHDMPLLEELRQLGASDYVVLPFPFIDKNRSAFISFATRVRGGFTDEQLAALETAAQIFSPYAERYVLRRIAIDLLDTYLGPRSGEKVFSGTIERGAVENIRAAICMADLKGFTRYSDEQSIETVVATLNEFLGIMAQAIEREGGEVLKFMGDAILAIFPEADGNLKGPCRAAVSAVRQACDDIDAVNETRRNDGRPPLGFGLALHAGEVAYGNIGGRSRLDFTVIGPAVNHTSRMLELSKKLDRSVLISGGFVEASGMPLARLGKFRLRDVARSHDIYTLDETVAQPAKSAKMRR